MKNESQKESAVQKKNAQWQGCLPSWMYLWFIMKHLKMEKKKSKSGVCNCWTSGDSGEEEFPEKKFNKLEIGGSKICVRQGKKRLSALFLQKCRNFCRKLQKLHKFHHKRSGGSGGGTSCCWAVRGTSFSFRSSSVWQLYS